MPEVLQQLIRTLSRLPGIGRRSAERMAYRLLTDKRGLMAELRHALIRAEEGLVLCPRCGNLMEKGREACSICQDPSRDPQMLCVVEGAPDIQILEQAHSFRGLYYCLRGKISPMQDETVTRNVLNHLLERIQGEEVKEVVLALNTDVESDATASMLADLIRPLGVRVSRLAFGLPSGSGLAYSDPETLKRAMEGRQKLPD